MKKIGGVEGVLGGLLEPNESNPEPAPPTTEKADRPEAPPALPVVRTSDKPDEESKVSPARPRTRSTAAVKARLGRPPGRKSGKNELKKKTTLWVKAQVIDDYVQWSWEERCNLGTLVERALAEYQRRYHKPKRATRGAGATEEE